MTLPSNKVRRFFLDVVGELNSTTPLQGVLKQGRNFLGWLNTSRYFPGCLAHISSFEAYLHAAVCHTCRESGVISELSCQSLTVEAPSLRFPEERFFMESWSFSVK